MVDVEQSLSKLTEYLDALLQTQLPIGSIVSDHELIKIALLAIFSKQFCRRVIPWFASVRKVLVTQDVLVLASPKHVQLALNVYHATAGVPGKHFADVELWFESRAWLRFAAPA